MSTYRIYVDSRGKMEGTDTDFTFELPYSISIKEKSLAMIDVVCIPNNILTVTENKNDTIWLKDHGMLKRHFTESQILSLVIILFRHCGKQSNML